MTVYVQVVNTAIGLPLQQEYIKLGDVSIVKMMLTTAICFGLMVNVDTAVLKMEYTKWVVKQEKFKLTYKCILYYTKRLKNV